MKRVLLIAYHYPPIKGSSGLQRTLRYSMYLQKFGWQVQMLTVNPRAYENTSDDELKDIPDNVPVHRAFALDTKRHLSLFGRYPGFLARPDRWVSWYFDGVRKGRKIIRDFNPDVIWSTFPIPTAHKIGLSLARSSNLPWVADFRDLLTEEAWPSDPTLRRRLKKFEREIVSQAAYCVFTAPGAANYYRTAYADQPGDKFVCLPNGFDEQSFEGLASQPQPSDGSIVLLHAGIMYPLERDPGPLFEAIAKLKQSGEIDPKRFLVRLRATSNDAQIAEKIAAANVSDCVELAPALPYRDVLQEMMDCAGLLIFQDHNCNRQIPAKLYEYFRAGRPILALTDAKGDTAAQIRSEDAGLICAIDDVDEIVVQLRRFIIGLKQGDLASIQSERISRYSREQQTQKLAELLNATVN